MQQITESKMIEEKDSILVKYGIERLIISVIFNFILGLAVLVGLKSLGIPLLIAILFAVLSISIGTFILTKRLPSELNDIRKRKPWMSTLWLLVALIGAVYLARISIFMMYPLQTQYSLFGDKWVVEHCCLTAYNESAKFALEGEKNIYQPVLYRGAESLINKEFRRKLDGFNVDNYHYPPPFLLLPITASAVVGGNFLDLRMLWFALGVLCLMSTIGLIIYRLEPDGRMRMIGMSPLIWFSIPVLIGLQMSNVQIIIISLSIISMLLFSTNKAAGGVLLGFSSVAKIFPGILVVHLLAKRKFQEVFWIAGLAIVLTVLSFIVVGPEPFKAFIESELPKLSSGEAFTGPFSNNNAVAVNMAPFGIPIKLGKLGVPGMTLEIGRIVSSIFLIIVLILAFWSARRKPRSNTEMISVWISLVGLGSLVSPFSPANYALIFLVLLVCLNREFFRPWLVITICLFISLPFLISREAPFLIQALAFLPAQIFAIGIPAYILYRAGQKTANEKEALSNVTFSP